ncbi:hypothetical protein EST38_g14355 [Candolleomyces aberdarensis]|uniref:Uncharacterized protein n=1 Tax=Candolleomyces aberdarensis TaxID=2316362 RepID=A0A4Q2CXH6_9AGAR|nr:hypothetical protein EST38_g14355 [Candolleomyces aberdarensis]
MNVNPNGFLSTKEEKLVHHLIKTCEDGFAWDKLEKGIFSSNYLNPVCIPTLDHNVWIKSNIPIPRGLQPNIIKILKEKQAAGRAYYSVLDLFVGFDQCELHPDSRNLTTFQSPLGTFRLTRIPMGYTNSQQVQHGNLTFILQDQIPKVTMPFVDDVPVCGPATQYELPDGGFKMIPDNLGIRRFINASYLAFQEVSHLCTYEGRRPLPDRVQKIVDWPIPRDLTSVRGLLGTVGTMRMFIKNYTVHSEPLVCLTHHAKSKEFVFGPDELEAMEKIKIILAVNSSHIAIGYILSQNG